MTKPGRHEGAFRQKVQVSTLLAAFSIALLTCSTAYAARLGHSRVVSGPGQPLKIDVPLLQIDPASVDTLQVGLAAQSAWKQAGLTPPVSLASMHVRVLYGADSNSRLVQITSAQPFNRAVADILLDVRTATGSQVYQVSILTRMQGENGPLSVAEQTGLSAAPGSGAGRHVAQKRIPVNRGDTMFAIARRNAVAGVSVYQMMIGLQRANAQAFIRHNLNLVKAGAVLVMPDKAALTAISDREARRLFVQQVQAFEQYRQRLAGAAVAPVAGASAAQGKVTRQASGQVKAQPSVTRDEVVLSGGVQGSGNASDQRTAKRLAAADSGQRIAQLEHNVKQLRQATDENGSDPSAAASGANASAGDSGSFGAAGALAGASTGQSSMEGAASAGQSGVGTPNSAAGAASASGVQPRSGAAAPNMAKNSNRGATAGGAQQSRGGAMASSSGVAGAASSANDASTTNRATSSANGASTTTNGATSSASGATSSANGAAPTSGKTSPANSATSAMNGATPSASGAVSPANGAASSSETAPNAAASSTNGAGSAASTAPSVSGATSSGSGVASTNGSGAASGTAPGAAAGAAGGSGGASFATPGPDGESATPGSNGGSSAGKPAQAGSQDKVDKNVSWFEEHLLASITVGLALIVLIIAWLLRRMNAARDDDGGDHHTQITEAMVQEKLDQIDLDLHQSPTDASSPAKS